MKRNKHTAKFYERVKRTSLALQQLDELGCAIVSLGIDDNGNNITILPPPNNALPAFQASITNDINGRKYGMLARIHGCNVTWQKSDIQ